MSNWYVFLSLNTEVQHPISAAPGIREKGCAKCSHNIIVSRDIRAEPGASGFGEHKDVSLYKLYSRWTLCGDWIIFALEVRSPSQLTFDVHGIMRISLPGAIGMYGLSLGVAQIGDTLPLPVYALLACLSSSTVGIIALAAMQLAQMAVTDRLTRALVFLGGAGGMLYTALWYYPTLMMASGVATLLWDFRVLQRLFAYILRKPKPPAPKPHRRSTHEIYAEINRNLTDDDLQKFIYRRSLYIGDIEAPARDPLEEIEDSPITKPQEVELNVLTWKVGSCILAIFALSFIAVMILHVFVLNPSRGIAIFQNLYLAGTIIFGGGPVAIPLLKEYIVAEGWVSQRDFLIGLALIQAFPGPNFNFAVYLGALATAGTSVPSLGGALIAYFAIFLPGLFILTGTLGLWKILRSKTWLKSLLRGVNAGAVGLVFTAVYKLWQIGAVSPTYAGGQPLGTDPWWVAIAATAFVGGCWFDLRAPFAILLGGCMGLGWYGAVRPWQ
jgi:chromate transport protein ChrA